MKKRVLITGSSGMLGIDLWQELSADHSVYGTDLIERKACDIAHFNRCDITDRERLIDVVSEIGPEVVIHTAAWTDVDGCELDKDRAYKINSQGTDSVAVACKKTGSILIYISTDFVFDGKKTKPYKETDKTNPLSTYGDSKLRGEESIRKNLKKYFIIRTSWLYGRCGKNFVETVLSKSNTEKDLKVVSDQVGSPTYTKDLAQAIHALVDRISGEEVAGRGHGIYHVSNSGSVSWFEYAEEILRLAGSKTRVIPISSEELGRPARRPAMSVLDNSKFIKFTGHKMRGWREALKEYFKRRGQDA